MLHGEGGRADLLDEDEGPSLDLLQQGQQHRRLGLGRGIGAEESLRDILGSGADAPDADPDVLLEEIRR